MKLGRREVLVGLGAVAAGCATQGPTGAFPLGVATGDAGPEGAILWTFSPGASALSTLVWRESEGADRATRRDVTPDEGFALVELDGLDAATWYRYRFERPSGEASAEGRFRTALAADSSAPLIIGATSCIKSGYSYAALARAAERTDLDAFIFLGDAVYTDGSSSVADFRSKWADGLGAPEYLALRGSTSLITQWDDHEVRNDWNGDTVDPKLRATARKVFLEHQPMRAGSKLWRKLSWGKTAELFVLDCRSERDAKNGNYISPEQLDWLTRGLVESQAVFKLVLNTVPIGSFDTPFFAPFNGDNWQGFPKQRNELLQAIDDSGVKGVIFLSGDFHLASSGQVSRSGPGSTLPEFLVGPGAQGPNPVPSYPGPPQWDFSSAVNNYTTFELDPLTGVATVRYHSGQGLVIFEKQVG